MLIERPILRGISAHFFHDVAAFAAVVAAPLSLSKCQFPWKSLPIFFTMLLLMLPLRLFFFSSKMPMSRGISAHFFYDAAPFAAVAAALLSLSKC